MEPAGAFLITFKHVIDAQKPSVRYYCCYLEAKTSKERSGYDVSMT